MCVFVDVGNCVGVNAVAGACGAGGASVWIRVCVGGGIVRVCACVLCGVAIGVRVVGGVCVVVHGLDVGVYGVGDVV